MTRTIKIIFTIFCLCICYNRSYSQENSISSSYLKKEIIWFTDTMNNYYGERNSNFMVYVLHAFKEGDTPEKICYTLGYIINSSDFSDIDPDYYFRMNNVPILVRLGKDVDREDVPVKLNNLKRDSLINIVQKLHPSEVGYFSGVHRSIVYCPGNKGVKKIFYSKLDDIPREQSIFKYFPPEPVIEKIR